ncbi:1-phosphatidylinositol-4,5-bisphosphate phosphodiesterase epsilon-1 [Hibiscus syriacus]|uniref:non-specific serine/threonine protein kinase n=1 Tax=Hibiscus syriacus TaxID=106335 RepID=A0A6A2XVX8_HIBSY|nr:1-phosphatidylinositol-4,5-bisphosphate phosphodiesterase epsilon-1 [Hibiscus syriacus]
MQERIKLEGQHSWLSVVWFCLIFNAFVLVSSQPLALNCNSKGGKDEDGRNWEPDGKYLKSSNGSTLVQAGYQDPALLSKIPYMNARIFTSPATYEFPIKSKEHYLIRFHFYPSAYSNFNISNSYFSVTAGEVTLMKNFSAEITCKALTQAYLVRVFIGTAPLDSEVLPITFTPSTNYTNSFAFVNGIELITMPNLFGMTAMFGMGSQSEIDVSLENFQALFRLNADKDLKIDYGKLSRSSAPEDVYPTARSMEEEAGLNSKFNLTWIFQVDANSTCIVRLHFCDATIWIQMTPAVEMKPQFYDSLLNGVEIFKLNDGNKNFAGRNPKPSSMFFKAVTEQERSFNTESDNSVVIAGGAAAAFVLVAVTVFTSRKRKQAGEVESHTSSWLPIRGNSHSNGSKDGKSHSSYALTLAQGLSRHFSISEIRQATKNFNDSNVIGVGGFGNVYKGVIAGGAKVAIKRSNSSSEQGINEFQTEVEMLSKLRHKHLVSLIGFCEDGGEMCLVYDYMALGTFREHLYNNKEAHLSWKQRLEICIGAARGFHYLHTGAKYTIIHRDVKTTNILLDEKWVAKVSDFGLSKAGPEMNQGHALCARPALNPKLPKEQVSLADWARHCHKKGTLEEIIDPHLKGKRENKTRMPKEICRHGSEVPVRSGNPAPSHGRCLVEPRVCSSDARNISHGRVSSTCIRILC